jgi:hypothetical protein
LLVISQYTEAERRSDGRPDASCSAVRLAARFASHSGASVLVMESRSFEVSLDVLFPIAVSRSGTVITSCSDLLPKPSVRA